MRYLIVSDMHGNWDAFQAVLRRVRRKRFDATLVLGDLVGYGASPNQIVDELGSLPGRVFTVRGNHDKVAAGLEEGDDFNEVARFAARWTRDKLTPPNRKLVAELPCGPLRVAMSNGADIAMCHGSPADEDTYIFSEIEAREGFAAEPQSHLTFFGHTHVPSMFILHRGGIRGALLRNEGRMKLHPALRYLVNPGSVGQPRDRNPHAAFMTYDTDTRTLIWRRVRYPIRRAQRRILKAGLPDLLAERLAYGI